MGTLKNSRALQKCGLFLLCCVCFFCTLPFAKNIFAQSKVDAIALPIIMYHAVIPDSAQANEYAIRVSDFKKDLDYLKKNGFSTVSIQDLVDYSEGKPIAKKPILLTFDDGFYGVLSLAKPLLAEYGFRAECAVVGEYTKLTDGNLYSYLSYDEIKTLAEGNVFNVQSHTNDLHGLYPRKGVQIKKGENVDEYKQFLQDDLTKLDANLNKIGISPIGFMYPYGAYNSHAEEVLKARGIKATFICLEGVNYISQHPEELYLLKRFNRSGTGKSVEEILKNKI